jgi:16S rRNA (cytidine1402-2'-O)-methyltransferase
MSSLGNLYLLPVPISEDEIYSSIPLYNLAIIKQLRFFIAENAKTARRHLKLFGYENLQQADISELNLHTKQNDLAHLLTPLLAGHNMGLMSEAGCPSIADPGAEIVNLAHLKNIEVIPLTGPSAIVLSIMASGFTGQNFAFVGYLPIEKTQKIYRLKELEQLAQKQKQAQFFIETPYRNQALIDVMLQTLKPDTVVFIGKGITSVTQFLKTKTVAQWKITGLPELNKIPTVFGIYNY